MASFCGVLGQSGIGRHVDVAPRKGRIVEDTEPEQLTQLAADHVVDP